MPEHKTDELSTTGKHRAWAGETAGPVVRAGSTREVQRNWLDRALPSNPRHAAITRSLYSWSSYKNWTEKVRNDWGKDQDKDKGGK